MNTPKTTKNVTAPMTDTLKSLKDLVEAHLIENEEKAELKPVLEAFQMAIPAHLAKYIEGPHDPLYQQFVPNPLEASHAPDELADPVGDHRFSPLKGLVHRYPDRCLIKPISVCPVYCRYCFRKEQLGPGHKALTPEELEKIFDYIAADKNLWEVILTGGEPLYLKQKSLEHILNRLVDIPHIDILRIHTRLPVSSPEHLSKTLAPFLASLPKPVYLVVQINHPKELTEETRHCLSDWVNHGLPVLSQSVLLKGVNDDVDTLEHLMRALVRLKVRPYYLHHLDKVRGTQHFRVPITKGQALVKALRGRVSGLCHPTYVLDIPGGGGKIPIGPDYLQEKTSGTYELESPLSNTKTTLVDV